MLSEDISEIINRFKQGEKEVFNEILKNYKNSLVNFVFKFTGQTDLAEDMAQEIFLKVYQQLPRYKEQGKFSSWLFRLATNFCLNEIKRAKKHPQISLDEQYEDSEQYLHQRLADPSQEPPDQSLERQELIKQVQQALLSLPQTQRIALILSQYENMTYQEIATVLNTSVSAVESLIFRAKQSLRKKLSL
jgi:RNA polymerase sigma-70 factor, ECF subfamily